MTCCKKYVYVVGCTNNLNVSCKYEVPRILSELTLKTIGISGWCLNGFFTM